MQPLTSTVIKNCSIQQGKSEPLGASSDENGVNFAIFSQHADAIELCLFESATATKESCRFFLPGKTNNIWHGYVPGLRPGQLYGYRVYGPYLPREGHRFNSHMVLLDPYAKVIARGIQWNDSVFGYKTESPRKDLVMSRNDNAAFAPLAAVLDPDFDWEGDQPPAIPLHESIIYELHVKGMTQLHPALPESIRGSYSGLSSEPVLKHLKDLGVTAVELMPVHYHAREKRLVDLGLTNYWGYNTLSFFAPDSRYASSNDPQGVILEFKHMVKRFHQEGIEVILDVVYNHTAEGNRLGPTLSLRGIDNLVYYRLNDKNKRYYHDFTGCGNSLNLPHPYVQRLVLDSLRYWVSEMHVDGFRFDLATTLGREHDEFHPWGPFFQAIEKDPLLREVKLIAEPWDVGSGGYQLGQFPPGWSEWNGKFRDTIRGFWKGDEGTASELVTRLCGSSDLFEKAGRLTTASINFIASHDGFALQDLVTYNGKHNEANLEENRDGETHNLSWNCGVEGPTDDPKIIALRERQKRNMLATLFVSQGVPMISGGDELSRSQLGNNNAYCQDRELSWYHWNFWNENQRTFLDFVKLIVNLKKKYRVLKRQWFFHGKDYTNVGVKDVVCFKPDGREMSKSEWASYVRCLGVLFSGEHMSFGPKSEEESAETLLFLMNAHHESIDFILPKIKSYESWNVILDTAEAQSSERRHLPKEVYSLEDRSLVVFSAEKEYRSR